MVIIMNEYDFTLKFDLPSKGLDPSIFEDALFEAGCDDAIIGIGQLGRVALNFTREAQTAEEAVSSAISSVMKAIPEAKLIEATPDLVGLTDIADIIGCSRQNIRKVFISNMHNFPTPVHDGSSIIWHLAKVLPWFKTKGNYQVDDKLIEVSIANMRINITKEIRDLEMIA